MDAAFETLIAGIRRGDAEAAARLVREFEPEIRRAVRIYIHDSPLKRQLDSMDICQSVLADFFVRAAAGQFDLTQPEKVLGLLVTMARNKLTDKARALKGPRRHPGGEQAEGTEILQEIVDPAASPSRILQGQELMQKIKQHLTAKEAILFDYRAEGLEWPEIAVKLYAKPDSLRKQFARALDRVVKEMDVAGWEP
jgi:RNA polymerase sigma factor (sigma-70 family)